MAHHPAAQQDPGAAAARGRSAAATPRPVPAVVPPAAGHHPVLVWVVLAALLALVLVLMAGVFGVASQSGTVETRHQAMGTAGGTDGGDRSVTGSSASTTTGEAPSSTAGAPATGSPPTGSPPTGSPPTGSPPTGSPPTGSPLTPAGEGVPGTSVGTASPAEEGSSTTTGPSRVPTGREDCRNGGWARLTDGQGRPFEDQGACVSYVNQP